MNNVDVIAAEQLSLGYDHQPIVSNMTFTIKKGEFIGILGPNGAGKSTFLKSILGLISPLSGELKVFGEKAQKGNVKIGYMPQMRTLVSTANLTSRALLEATASGLRYGLPISSKARKNEIENVLTLVNANSYADRPFQQLSGGERQRIFLAQALLGRPEILLLDEPLSNLDPKYQEIFIRLLNEVKHHFNMTILFTAHDPNPLLNVMNRVLFFAQGRIAMGETEKIITSETLSRLYETDIEVIHFKNKIFVLSENQYNILGQGVDHHD